MPVCLFCSSQKNKSTVFEDTIFNNKRFKYIQCTDCSLIYLNPLPDSDDLFHMYPKEYQGAIVKATPGRYTHLFKLIEKHLPNKTRITLLDYGCGAGQFLSACTNERFLTTGVEYNPDLVNLLQIELPNSTFYTTEDFLKNNTDTFDVILLNNVLEHLTNPSKIVNILKSRLSKDGIFLLEGPVENNFNLGLLVRKSIFGIRKYGFGKTARHTPTHIIYSNRNNQRRFFERCGLHELELQINEYPWPLPATWGQTKSISNKILFIIGQLSLWLKKLNKNWGNTFIYAGRLK